MRLNTLAFSCGLFFAVGLGVSGMTQPARIVGFLDFSGRWDPTLAFVMGAALAVMLGANRLPGRLGKPIYGSAFPLPPPSRIDPRLVGGAAIFGAGWGLGGLCPGPAIASLGAAAVPSIIFVAAMAVGIVIHNVLFLPRLPARDAIAETATADH